MVFCMGGGVLCASAAHLLYPPIRRTLRILSQNTGFRFLEFISKLKKTSKPRLLQLVKQDRGLEKENSQSLRSRRSVPTTFDRRPKTPNIARCYAEIY